MENAIYKSNGKIVSAYKILKSLEWIGKEREEFIAPFHEIGNWQELNNKNINEVKVSFVTRHKRKLENGETILVQSHFRIETEGAIENPNNESEEHKLAKENIYDLAIEDLLLVDGKKLSDIGEIEDIRIECQSGKKRADVLIKFKNFHDIYGCGIAFEIQISPQKIEKTEERNYDRASYGYSIVWLWNGELEQSNFKIIPYSEAIKDYHKQLKIQSEKILWDIDERTNNKVLEITDIIEKKLNSLRIIRDLTESKIKDNLQNLTELSVDIENEIESVKKDIETETLNELKEKTRQDIKEILSSKIKEYDFEQKIQELLSDSHKYYRELINKKINEDTWLNIIPFEIKNNLSIKAKEEIDKSISKMVYDNNYDIKIKIDDKIKDYIRNVDIDSLFKRYINEYKETFLKNFKQIFLDSFQELVKNEMENNLSIELSKLKAESISEFTKSKTSLYIECPVCKKDSHIINTEIQKKGDLFSIICNNCKERKEEDERKNKN